MIYHNIPAMSRGIGRKERWRGRISSAAGPYWVERSEARCTAAMPIDHDSGRRSGPVHIAQESHGRGRPGPARSHRAHGDHGQASRARDTHHTALSRGHGTSPVRNGLLLGRRADVLVLAGRVHHGGGLRRWDHSQPDVPRGVSGRTGHTEAVLVVFDPAVTSYESLLGVFF